MKNEIAAPEEAGMSSQRLELIKPAMQTYVDRKKIAGLSTMIARNGKVELMHMNYLPAALLPCKVVDPPAYAYGFGLGSRVLINVAESEKPGSVGEFGWGGAAKTY
jgi:hypothetical protein